MPEGSVVMAIFEYTVKFNGRKYYPGEDVPIEEHKAEVKPKKEPKVEEKTVEEVIEKVVEKTTEKKAPAKAKSTKAK